MPRNAIFPLVLLGATLSVAPAARAHWFSGRHWGVGWGDGYHAFNACPSNSTSAWAVGVPQAEILPHPTTRAVGRPHAPSGPSLFRQPGEGSSVIVSEAPPGNP